jgi:hypothetical protein
MVVGLLLFAGEAMYSYCEERRILVIRLHAKVQGRITTPNPNDVYRAGESWMAFPVRKKINSIVGLLQFKSVYLVMALSYISFSAFLAGLAVLAAYKHLSWLKLIGETVNRPPALREA